MALTFKNGSKSAFAILNGTIFAFYPVDMSISGTDGLGMRLPGVNASTADAKKLQVAQEFEAMFIHQMLKSMRNTVPKDENTSTGRRIFTEMMDEQIANTASRTGSFGLAQIIYKELTGKDEMPMNTPPKASEKQVETWVNEASASTNMDKNLIKAVIHQESGGNSLARSDKGAKGLMQLMDPTAKEMGVINSYNGRENIMGGTKYLKLLLERFNGDESKALAAYNAGPTAVENYGTVPPFQETQNYVKNVLQYREQLSQETAL